MNDREEMKRALGASDHELFLKALDNAIAWQNRYVELYELLEMFCMDAAAHNTGEQK